MPPTTQSDQIPKSEYLDDFTLSTTAFEALERDFQEVLSELAGDEHLEKFRMEYEKLHRTLVKSHENEKKLMKKCAELNGEIVANASKVHTALKLSQDDQNTIFQLKKEIEKAWKMVEQSHEKESRARQTVNNLQKEIATLQQLVDHGVGSSQQESTIEEYKKDRRELEKKIEQQEQQIVGLINDTNLLNQQYKKSQEHKKQLIADIAKLKEELSHKKIELEKEERNKQLAEKNLLEAKFHTEKKQDELNDRMSTIQMHLDTIATLKQKSSQVNKYLDQEKKNHLATQDKYTKTHDELKKRITENSDLNAQKQKLEFELAEMETEKNRFQNLLNDEMKKRQKAQAEIVRLQQKLKDRQEEKLAFQREIQDLKADTEQIKKQWDKDLGRMDQMKHLEKSLNKTIKDAHGELDNQKETIGSVKAQKEKLERKINIYRQEAEETRKTIYNLEREREKYATSASEALQKYNNSKEQVKIKTLEAQDAQKKVSEYKDKLKNLDTLYEAVRSDRNMYSKNLLEANEQIREFKEKFDIMKQQMQQLNDEITVNDKTLMKVHKDFKESQEENRKINDQLTNYKKHIEELNKRFDERESEIQRLNKIIKETDVEREKQRKELEAVVNTRDILGTQLIRRNDELALLYEKIRIQQGALNKGAVQYRQRLDDIKQLKQKVNEMHRSAVLLQDEVSTIAGLKNQIHNLQRQLFEERMKVKALSEELENPMNVHRWRKLEGQDPTAYEMILRIQTLQKRLIKKTEEVMERDTIVQEKDNIIQELEKILKRQPGPELAEKLNLYQDELRKKESQMKTMASELNMYMFQVKESKYEAERVSRDLSELRKRYYTIKKKEQKKQVARHSASAEFPVRMAPGNRHFMGGGFGLNMTAPNGIAPGAMVNSTRIESSAKASAPVHHKMEKI